MHIQGCDKMLKQVGIIEAEIMPGKKPQTAWKSGVVAAPALRCFLILSYPESPRLSYLVLSWKPTLSVSHSEWKLWEKLSPTVWDISYEKRTQELFTFFPRCFLRISITLTTTNHKRSQWSIPWMQKLDFKVFMVDSSFKVIRMSRRPESRSSGIILNFLPKIRPRTLKLSSRFTHSFCKPFWAKNQTQFLFFGCMIAC